MVRAIEATLTSICSASRGEAGAEGDSRDADDADETDDAEAASADGAAARSCDANEIVLGAEENAGNGRRPCADDDGRAGGKI